MCWFDLRKSLDIHGMMDNSSERKRVPFNDQFYWLQTTRCTKTTRLLHHYCGRRSSSLETSVSDTGRWLVCSPPRKDVEGQRLSPALLIWTVAVVLREKSEVFWKLLDRRSVVTYRWILFSTVEFEREVRDVPTSSWRDLLRRHVDWTTRKEPRRSTIVQ